MIGATAPTPQLDVGIDDDVPWVDASHQRAVAGLTALVYGIDRFFGDPSHEQFNPPRSWVRLRGELRGGEPDPPGATRRRRRLEPAATVLAQLRLPSLDRLLSRASIVVAGSEDDEEAQAGTEQDLVPRRFGPAVRGAHGAAELRFDAFRSRRTVVDVGAGFRLRLPPPPYVRARIAHAAPLGLGLVAHLSQTGFWERRSGFGESSRVDVERAFGRRALARLWGIGTLHEESRGLEWSVEGGLAQALGRRTGVYLAGALEGATRAAADVDRYRLFTRLRRDVHQGWVYVELEPEVAWPVDGLGARARAFGATVRLELQFATKRRL